MGYFNNYQSMNTKMVYRLYLVYFVTLNYILKYPICCCQGTWRNDLARDSFFWFTKIQGLFGFIAIGAERDDFKSFNLRLSS